MTLDDLLVVPFDDSFDAAYGLEYRGGDDTEMRGRLVVSERVLGRDGTVQSGIYAAIAESLASTGTAVGALPLGLIPAGLGNSTHIVGEARAGALLDAVARRRARGALEWLWDVEITDADGAICAIAAVVIAIRPRAPRTTA
jgi:1,4-dihydroxy-2-naphthoyl-CoA hydrolase